MNDTKPNTLVFPLKISRALWGDWKKVVPRELSMNAALTELIKQDITRKSL